MSRTQWAKVASVDEAVTKLASSVGNMALLGGLGAAAGAGGMAGLQALNPDDQDDDVASRYIYPAMQGGVLGGAAGAGLGYLSPYAADYMKTVMKGDNPQQLAAPPLDISPEDAEEAARLKAIADNPISPAHLGDPLGAVAGFGVAAPFFEAARRLNKPQLPAYREGIKDFIDPIYARDGLNKLLETPDDARVTQLLDDLGFMQDAESRAQMAAQAYANSQIANDPKLRRARTQAAMDAQAEARGAEFIRRKGDGRGYEGFKAVGDGQHIAEEAQRRFDQEIEKRRRASLGDSRTRALDELRKLRAQAQAAPNTDDYKAFARLMQDKPLAGRTLSQTGLGETDVDSVAPSLRNMLSNKLRGEAKATLPQYMPWTKSRMRGRGAAGVGLGLLGGLAGLGAAGLADSISPMGTDAKFNHLVRRSYK